MPGVAISTWGPAPPDGGPSDAGTMILSDRGSSAVPLRGLARKARHNSGRSLPSFASGATGARCLPLEQVHRLVYASQVIKDTGNVDDISIEVELGSGEIVRTPTSFKVRGVDA